MARAQRGEQNGNAMMLLGALAGAAIGAAIGLVYAPSDGEGNRKRLGEWAASRAQKMRPGKDETK